MVKRVAQLFLFITVLCSMQYTYASWWHCNITFHVVFTDNNPHKLSGVEVSGLWLRESAPHNSNFNYEVKGYMGSCGGNYNLVSNNGQYQIPDDSNSYDASDDTFVLVTIGANCPYKSSYGAHICPVSYQVL